jgi:hypothetical protein
MSRANFVQVQLAAAATDIQTTLSIKAPVGGLKLPPADGGRLVLTDSPGRPTAFEVISYTSRTGSGPYTLNGVVRGLEGTVGLAWAVDTFAVQSLTVGELDELLAGKVDKVAGQSLMTDAERAKLDGIQAGAQVNSVTSVAGKTGAVSLAKGDVGLGNVDNTSDANKPISAATQIALDAKAPLASPVFTGTPSVPTPAAGTNTTQIANTAFVQAALTALVDSSPAALDTLNELAAALGDDPNFATTMTNALALKAPLASPALTGNPTAPTPATEDADTSIATTAFVRAAMGLFGLNNPTAGALMAVGAFGLGAADSSIMEADNVWKGSRIRGWSSTAAASPASGTEAVGLDLGYTSGRRFQMVVSRYNDLLFRYTADPTVGGDWRRVFNDRNILGTVSQSGGVPTGAIIERGSNANGEYTRYADGTQECWFKTSGDAAADKTWTFPAAFSTAPTCFASPRTSSNGYTASTRATETTTSTTFAIFDPAGARTANGVNLHAKGRWFN